MPRLSGLTCVVTGAGRGIGRAIAHAFHAEGATVIATDKDEASGRAAAEAIGCRFERLDIGSEADWLAFERLVPCSSSTAELALWRGNCSASHRSLRTPYQVLDP